MLRSFRYLLYPFSVLYGMVVSLRNKLYDKRIWHSASFSLPVICVGNLSVGGTGKTPMIEYLVALLQRQYKVATLSRGYKRKTKGFSLADEHSTAVDIGDEPMQVHIKFPSISVAVAEERVVGIPQLLHERPETSVILLDDAFQHRAVSAGLNILLTDYSNLFTRDILLPAGDLRDNRSSSKRADIIVVTKCPSTLSRSEKEKISRELNLQPHQSVFFTKVQYGAPYHLFDKNERIPNRNTGLLLVCGIANPAPLKLAMTAIADTYEALVFSDHHIFSMADLAEMKKQFDKIPGVDKMIITTEKDAVRLQKFQGEISQLPVYVLPMHHRFLFDEGVIFDQRILNFVDGFTDSE